MPPELDEGTLSGAEKLSPCHICAVFLGGGERGGERRAEAGGASRPASAQWRLKSLSSFPSPAASTWLLPVLAKLPSPFPQGQSAKKPGRRRAKTIRQGGPLGKERGG